MTPPSKTPRRSCWETPRETRAFRVRYRGVVHDLPERSRLVQQHLIEAGVTTEIRMLPDSARTAPEAAAAIGCDVSAIANSLVFVADGAPVLVMTSGGHRVDLDVLARSTGAAAIAMAPAS